MPLRSFSSVISDQGPLALATVTQTYPDLIAPTGIVFQVKNIPQEVYHYGGFVWTFSDDESSDAYAVLRDDHLFKTTGKAKKIGPKANRAYTTTGSKSWSVTIYYQGYTRTISGTTTISQHENDAYADADTYYVSTSSDFPVGASNTYTDLGTCLAATSGDAHIRLRAGESFGHDGAQYTRSAAKIVLSSYGEGARPEVYVNALDTGDCFDVYVQDLKVAGVRMFGNYDPTTESTTDANVRRGINSSSGGSDRTIFIHDLQTEGIAHNIYAADDGTEGNTFTFDHRLIFLSELHAISRSNFALFGDAEVIALEGCNIDQVVGARGGGRPSSTPSTNIHGPTRIVRVLVYVNQCSNMYSPHGWQDPAGLPNHQGCQRLLTTSNPGCESATTQCQMESGSPVISHESSAGANYSKDWIGRHTYQSNYVIGTSNVPQMFMCGHAGTSILNNIFYFPAVPTEDDKFQRFVEARAMEENPRGEDLAQPPVVIRGNIFAILASNAQGTVNTTNFKWISDETAWNNAGFYNLDFGDNLEYAPNLTGLSDPVSADYSPIDTSTVLTPKYPGLVYWDQTTLDTTYASPTEGAALFQPQAGSAALGAASVRLELDFWGNPRSETTSIGAFDGAA